MLPEHGVLVMRAAVHRAAKLGGRLGREQGGLALIEFGLAVPLVLAVGGYGMELANLAYANMQVSQYAMDLADSAARMGDESGLATYTIDESNINDALQGLRLQGAGLKLTTYGRITLSSLEGTGGKQWLHWQRCIGAASYANYQSSYGTASPTPGNVPDTGMGDTGYKVTAQDNSGVMFVEVNYLYQPLFGTMFVAPKRIHYVASYIVRDDARSYSAGVSNITNLPSSQISNCGAYKA